MSQKTAELLHAIREGEMFDDIEAGPGVTGLCEKSLPAEVREDFLRKDVLWEPRGDVLKPGSRSTVTEVEIGGTRYVLKQYKKMVLRRRLRYAVTRTRSMQSWEQGQLMSQLELPVSRPLAILVERNFGVPARSKLLMEVVKGDSVKDIAMEEGGARRLEVALPFLREFFARLAEHHLVHGDLSASNVILDDENRPYFIDLDASVFIASDSRFRRCSKDDLLGFMKNWRKNPEAAEVFRPLVEPREG